tara:strand:- start:462 stop:1127 length:666 start_codon:yes stop_codon:yes gene_type:complete
MREKKFLQNLHNSTKRNYLERMNDPKRVHNMKTAKKFGNQYWDGPRKYGYGGHRYIPGRWLSLAKKLIRTYKLGNDSKVLDLGCGKGYLLYELKKLLPLIKITGLDISSYAIKNSKVEVKNFLKIYDARKKLRFKKNYFDLAVSLGTFHCFKIKDLDFALKEMNRVSKKQYIMVESYRNDRELSNLQCWGLTCLSFYHDNDWVYIFKKNNFSGDYEFIRFQ